MSGGYDDRDGKIWFDGNFVDWRDANVHVLTHAMHYASSVFEGERAYNGKIFKSVEHSERFKKSANLIDFEIPYTVEEIENAKYQALEKNGLSDAYVRAFAWRGAGEDMGVASSRNPVRVAVAVWSWEITTVMQNLKGPNQTQQSGEDQIQQRRHHKQKLLVFI